MTLLAVKSYGIVNHPSNLIEKDPYRTVKQDFRCSMEPLTAQFSPFLAEKKMDFVICQQPEQGRMCGFSNLPDRRMLDPPLVLKLRIPQDRQRFLHDRIFCVVTLLTTSDKHLGSILKQNSPQPSLVLFGETCCHGHILEDFENPSESSLYFIFADLSVRVKGEYKLACHLVDMNNLDRNYEPVISNPFIIYPPKQFPGMLASTDLTKHLFSQGIHIRRREYKFAAQPGQDVDGNDSSKGETGSSKTLKRNSVDYTPSE